MSTSTDTLPLETQQTLKFLVSNVFAGSIIGVKGNAIKELMEVSGARVSISGNKEFYPGTSDRVLVMTGSLESLLIAITLTWELIYLQTQSTNKGGRPPVWSPLASKDFLTAKDDIELTARITIPAAAGGLILGRGGSTLRVIMESSGANVQMTNKEEAVFTQERIVTISGTVSQGRLCSQMILQKMIEEDESNTYANRGTRYSASASGLPGLRRGRDTRITGKKDEAEAVVADTTITITVADSLIGNIIGKNGATLREMSSLSGAKIVVSSREESVDGIRTVTITGDPIAAQTAHAFCTEKIRQGKYLKPKGGRRLNKDTDPAIDE